MPTATQTKGIGDWHSCPTGYYTHEKESVIVATKAITTNSSIRICTCHAYANDEGDLSKCTARSITANLQYWQYKATAQPNSALADHGSAMVDALGKSYEIFQNCRVDASSSSNCPDNPTPILGENSFLGRRGKSGRKKGGKKQTKIRKAFLPPCFTSGKECAVWRTPVGHSALPVQELTQLNFLDMVKRYLEDAYASSTPSGCPNGSFQVKINHKRPKDSKIRLAGVDPKGWKGLLQMYYYRGGAAIGKAKSESCYEHKGKRDFNGRLLFKITRATDDKLTGQMMRGWANVKAEGILDCAGKTGQAYEPTLRRAIANTRFIVAKAMMSGEKKGTADLLKLA